MRAPEMVGAAPPKRQGSQMFTNPDEVMRYIQEEDVKFIDVRFCDLPGVMQHFNVPAESVDEEFFANGQMFDGSSIRGFQAIHESDMKLTPDLGSAYLDPFRAEKTLRSEERRVGKECRARWTAY